MTTLPPEAATPPATPKPRKRRRWWKILVAIIIILFLIILFLPTILSTGPGKNFILSEINARSPDKLNAEAISLGWFSGISIHKLDVNDANQKPVISVDNVNTGVTLWNVLVGSVIDLKNVVVTGGKLPQLPGTTVTVHLVGTADLGKKLADITADSTISALGDKSQRGTTVTLQKDSKFSWGTAAGDAHVTLAYDLAQIQTILAASLPEGTQLAGARTEHFHITGALTNEAGAKALKGIRIDPTSIGFDKVSCKGLNLGKADIPFQMNGGILTFTPTEVPANGGNLLVTGSVDFAADTPTYILPANPAGYQIAQNVGLNHEIAANWLAAFPLAWGGMDQSANLASVSGKLNVKLASARIPFQSAAFKAKGALAGSLNITNLTTDAPFLAGLTKSLGPVLKITQPDLLTIKGGNIPNVPFALADGKISYQNLRLGTASVSINFSGSVGPDQSLAMSAELTAAKLNVPIPIGLKGTTAKPELTITGGLPGGIGNNPQDLGKSLQKAVPGLLNQFNKKK